jgi:hypothetical protein
MMIGHDDVPLDESGDGLDLRSPALALPSPIGDGASCATTEAVCAEVRDRRCAGDDHADGGDMDDAGRIEVCLFDFDDADR